MPCSTADAIRGTLTAVVVGVWSSLLPSTDLPHGFGYYVAIAVLLLGLRFGFRATGMLLACCIAVAVAGATAGRGPCTASSDHVTCAFDAAEPLLIFGYFIGPTLAGALVAGFVGVSKTLMHGRGIASTARTRTLLTGHTITVAAAAAATSFIVFTLAPLPGPHQVLAGLAACVAFGLGPSYAAERTTPPATAIDRPSW
jgi:hypothetical protein